jgi:large subunit ribosomal protein L37e
MRHVTEDQHADISSGTGRMAHLKSVHRRFKNGFREGTAATKKTASA